MKQEEEKQEKKRRKVEKKLAPLLEVKAAKDDPEGSWTGVPKDGGRPLQDADDL